MPSAAAASARPPSGTAPASASRSRGVAHGRSALTTRYGAGAPAATAASSAARTAAPWPRRGSGTCSTPAGQRRRAGATTKSTADRRRGGEHVGEHRLGEPDASRLRDRRRAGASDRCRGRERRRSPSLVDTTAVAAGPDNATIAERLETLAALLDLAGASTYSVRAYRRAAELIRATPAPVAELVRQGRVRGAARHRAVDRGAAAASSSRRAARARSTSSKPRCSPSSSASGGSSASARSAWSTSGRRSASAAPTSCARQRPPARLRDVPGIGAATEAKIAARRSSEPRPAPRRGLVLNRARALAGGDRGRRSAACPQATRAAGATVGAARRRRHRRRRRRRCSTASPRCRRSSPCSNASRTGRSASPSRACRSRLVAAPADRFGTELVRATGSETYVASLGALPTAADEEALFAALGRPFLPPELREAPFDGTPPVLVERSAIRGDLHVHTTWSDGKASVLEMAEAARALGYDYIAICDHTRERPRRPRARRGRPAPPGRGDRGGERAPRAVPHPARQRVRHPRRRHARPARRRPRRARLGAGIRARRASGSRASS